MLSMNSRSSINTLSHNLGIGISATRSRIKKLEEQLGIKYLLELDIEKLGFSPYITLVKFKDKPPLTNMLRTVLEKNPMVQFAAFLKGKFDLLIYSLGETPTNAFNNIHNMRRDLVLRNYCSKWYITSFAQSYSSIPLREIFIQSMLDAKNPPKHPEKTFSFATDLKHREIILISELNKDATKSFAEIDTKNSLGYGSARYAYNSLLEKEILVRPTISITNSQYKYIGLIQLDITLSAETYNTWVKRLVDYLSNEQLLNKYILAGYVGLPESLLLFMPVLREGSLEKTAESLWQTSPKGLRQRTLIMTEVLVGSLYNRRLDNNYFKSYMILRRLGGVGVENTLKYKETLAELNKIL